MPFSAILISDIQFINDSVIDCASCYFCCFFLVYVLCTWTIMKIVSWVKKKVLILEVIGPQRLYIYLNRGEENMFKVTSQNDIFCVVKMTLQIHIFRLRWRYNFVKWLCLDDANHLFLPWLDDISKEYVCCDLDDVINSYCIDCVLDDVTGSQCISPRSFGCPRVR